MLHSCGWLEGGLVSSFEKFVMDADQLGVLHGLATGIQVDKNAQAMDAIREVGPGGHYLGCEHTPYDVLLDELEKAKNRVLTYV